MINQEFTTPGDALLHYGVLGMKWGKSRARGSTVQIKQAHARDEAAKVAIRKADTNAARTADAGERAIKNMKVKEMKVARLNNPDRVLAARMTRGEKAAVLVVGKFTFVGLPIAVGAIAGTSARSRRIERKQETNKY